MLGARIFSWNPHNPTNNQSIRRFGFAHSRNSLPEAMLGNGVLGIQRESCSKWERRAPLTPSHCAQLLHAGYRSDQGVKRILVQPCTKRIYHDIQYANVGCQISEDLSECGLVLGVKQPQPGTLLPERAYAFFSHTHKAQAENMPLLDEVLAKKVTLYDYERIVGENGERLVAFGEYAGRAGMIDFLRGLGERYLSLGYSTPFLSIGSSYMYMSLSAAKAAVLAAGDEIRTSGLPFQISPLIFIFTGTGNVSRGAQEIFRLLPHAFVDPSELPRLVESLSEKQADDSYSKVRCKRETFQVYGCVVTAEHMVAPNDPGQIFDKAKYYAHPEQYHSIFHENIAPYASAIVNCIYWEKRYPRLLTNEQLQKITSADKKINTRDFSYRLIGIADITCDIGGSIECVNRTTSIEQPFFRYNPTSDSYFDDMNGEGIILLAVDNLPTELPKEATNHFGDVLLQFLTDMVNAGSLSDLVLPIQQACIAYRGQLTLLYEYIDRMWQSNDRRCPLDANAQEKAQIQFKTTVSLDGHLFDQFLINEALDVIEKAGGQFHLATCQLGQTVDATSHAELEVMADSQEALSQIVDLLASVAHHSESGNIYPHEKKRFLRESSLQIASSNDGVIQQKSDCNENNLAKVLIIGAGRMCEPAVNYLVYHGLCLDETFLGEQTAPVSGSYGGSGVWVTVASLFLEDAVKATEGVPNTSAVQLDVADDAQLHSLISKVSVVISLLPPAYHITVANCCIETGRHLVTASYVSKEMSSLHDRAKSANVTLLCEMGLDPGIDHMMAMRMINSAHMRGGHVESFISYCGGLPSPASANNPLGYKFSWNPAGALKAGRNPAVYKSHGKIISVPGENLFTSAIPLRFPNLPAFALERLPNRNSLEYGDLYGISEEASTILRATLRYEGYGEIMNSLASLGFFSMEANPLLQNKDIACPRASYRLLLEDLMLRVSQRGGMSMLSNPGNSATATLKNNAETLVRLGCCKTDITGKQVSACISHLGLDAEEEISALCTSAFDVLCSRMEEKLAYAQNEQDMVLLHHEMEIAYQDGRPTEKHSATLLEFGELGPPKNSPFQKPQTAMACTVGLPAAIGAQLLLLGNVKSRGVLRPLDPEIYMPVLRILETSGVNIKENLEYM